MISINDVHLAVLYAVAIALDAKTVVELGTGWGQATEVLSEAMKNTGGKVYSVEKYPEKNEVKLTKERLRDKTNITFITGDSVEVGRNWNNRVDILYADSDHQYEHVLNELRVWGSKTKIILVHDIYHPQTGQKWNPYKACEDYAKQTNATFIPVKADVPSQSIGIILFRRL